MRRCGDPAVQRNPMRKLVFALLVAGFTLCGQAVPRVPDTPAGKVFSRWLDLFNRGKRAELEQFLKTYLPDRSVDEELGFRGQTGGFDLQTIESSTETK